MRYNQATDTGRRIGAAQAIRTHLRGPQMNTGRFREFVRNFTLLIERAHADEPRLFSAGEPLLAALVAHDDWLPDAWAEASRESYRQYLLYCDPFERFSVVSFVWGPGQKTPVHDHMVWGMIGMLRGRERCRELALAGPGQPMRETGVHLIEPGQVDRVSPATGDIHEVSNALADASSVSIHVYGANIGAVPRHVYDPATGKAGPFVSGYTLGTVPNWWDRSQSVRAALAVHPV